MLQDLSPFVHQDHVGRLQRKARTPVSPASLAPAPNPEAIRKASNPIALRYWSQCVQAAAAVPDPVITEIQPTAAPLLPASPAFNLCVAPALAAHAPSALVPGYQPTSLQQSVNRPDYYSPEKKPPWSSGAGGPVAGRLGGGGGWSPAEDVPPPWHQPDYCATPLLPQAAIPSNRLAVARKARTDHPALTVSWAARSRSVPRDFAQTAGAPPCSSTADSQAYRRQPQDIRGSSLLAQPGYRSRAAVGPASPLPSRKVLDLYSAAAPASRGLPTSPPARQRSRTPWAEDVSDPAASGCPAVSSGHVFCAQRKVLA
jgi:hypothetical protein